MSLELLETFSVLTEDALTTKVFRDTEWDEYVVRLYRNGIEQVMASYHTDYKRDAVDTAWAMINQGEKVSSRSKKMTNDHAHELATALRMSNLYKDDEKYTAHARAWDHAFSYDADTPGHRFWRNVCAHLEKMATIEKEMK